MLEGRRILIVDGEPELADAIRGPIEAQNYLVLHSSDENETQAALRNALPDLVLLAMSDSNHEGLAILIAIRAASAVPVIVLGAGASEDDRARALHLGADDYLGPSIGPRELLARLESVLRRASLPPAVPPDALVVDADLTIDFARNRVLVRGQEEPLTATEHRLLYHLVSNAGRLMPYQALLLRVWGPEYRGDVHYVRLYVSYLRAKIEPDTAHPRYILTEKGLGYRFADLRPPGRYGSLERVMHFWDEGL